MRCSPAELTEWKALYNLDPWGEERADLRVGMLTAMVGNALKRKGGRKLRPQDFMLSDRRGRKQTPQQMLGVLHEFMAAQKAASRG